MKKLSLLLLAFLTIAMLTACMEEDDTEETTEERDVPVEVTEATEGELVIEKSIFGRTSPSNITPVMLQAPGEVDALEVENGDMVEEEDEVATVLSQMGTQAITAPASGQVIQLQASEGDLVSNEEPFFLIADVETMTVQFTVTADMLKELNQEETYDVIIDGKTYEAEVTSTSEMPSDNGLYPVEAEVENVDEAIISGLVAELIVPVERITDGIIVPTAAIVEDSEGAYVFVVEEDQVSKVEVTILESQSEETAISGEVGSGDEVVISGQLMLTDGSSIEVVTEESGE